MRAIIACFLFLSIACVEASTTFIPQFTAGIGYSDNIQLQEKENEIAESFFEINPGFLLQSEGRTHTLKAKYRMQNIFYSEDNDRNVRYNQLQADVTKSALGKVFFIDGSILHTQGAISPEYFYNRNSGASTGYFRDETYASISPYLKHTFGSSINSELRYKFSRVVYEKSSFDNRNKAASLRLDSMLHTGKFNWVFDYSKNNIEYDLDLISDIRLEKANIMLQYRLSSSFAIYSDIGYENNNYNFSKTKERPVGRFWLSGLIWSPSKRTRLKVASGKRFYGNTYSVDIRHRSRRLEQTFRYSEDILNISQVQGTIQAFDDTGVVMPPSFNALALNADAYIRKRAFLDIGYDIGGSRIGIDGTFENMENQANTDALDSLNAGSNKYKGIGLYWKKRLTQSTRLKVSSEVRRRNSLVQSGESQIKYSSFSIEHSLAKNASLSFTYSYSDSKGPIIYQNYIENYISSTVNLEW